MSKSIGYVMLSSLLVACGPAGAGAPMSEISGDGGAAVQAIAPSLQVEPPDAAASLELSVQVAPPSVATVAPAPLEPPQHRLKGPLLVGIWGQSNAVGMGTYPGTFVADARVTYYWNGTEFPLGPLWDRHGIELELGPALANATGTEVIIGKGAVDATDSASWLPGSGENWPHEMYTLVIMKRATDRPVHFCTLQGESDALTGVSYNQYLANLQAIAAGIRAGLAPLHVVFHIGLTNSHTPGAPTPIRQAQQDFAASDEGSDAIDFDDLVPAIAPNHYDSSQLLTVIAPRFEAAILGGRFSLASARTRTM